MSLIRFVARSMLASYFVINGAKAVRRPQDFAPAAQPLADKVLPLVNSALPETLRQKVPQDAAGLVRCNGALQVVGGLSLATGIGRRVGAMALVASMVPHVLASNPLKVPSAEREAARALLTKNVALTGGVLLASQDTEGRPDLGWRRQDRRLRMARDEAIRKRAARDAAASATRIARKSSRRSQVGVPS